MRGGHIFGSPSYSCVFIYFAIPSLGMQTMLGTYVCIYLPFQLKSDANESAPGRRAGILAGVTANWSFHVGKPRLRHAQPVRVSLHVLDFVLINVLVTHKRLQEHCS